MEYLQFLILSFYSHNRLQLLLRALIQRICLINLKVIQEIDHLNYNKQISKSESVLSYVYFRVLVTR